MSSFCGTFVRPLAARFPVPNWSTTVATWSGAKVPTVRLGQRKPLFPPKKFGAWKLWRPIFQGLHELQCTVLSLGYGWCSGVLRDVACSQAWAMTNCLDGMLYLLVGGCKHFSLFYFDYYVLISYVQMAQKQRNWLELWKEATWTLKLGTSPWVVGDKIDGMRAFEMEEHKLQSHSNISISNR